MGVGSGAMTPLVRLARSKVVGSVGMPVRKGGALPTGAVIPTRGGIGPESFLARRVLVTDSATGVTRLITGRVCGVHRDGGTLMHKRTSGVPGSKTRLGLVLSGLRRRRHTVARVFSNACGERRGVCAVHLGPTGRVGGRMTFQFSGGLNIMTGGSLTNRPICVALGGLGAIGVPRSSNGGGMSNITCGMPNGTSVLLARKGSILFRSRIPIARFKAMRCLTPALFGGGSAVGMAFGPIANNLIGISERRKGWAAVVRSLGGLWCK